MGFSFLLFHEKGRKEKLLQLNFVRQPFPFCHLSVTKGEQWHCAAMTEGVLLRKSFYHVTLKLQTYVKGEPRMRLDKYLAETAQCTRSEAKAMLSKGRVQVNGAVCKKGDTQLKESDTVAVDGRALSYQQFVYIMLNKPEGVVSASTDKRDTTVVDLVGDATRGAAVPAGRLDKTSTGFVLLTDDGTFAHDILAPKRHVSKTYTVVLDTPLTEQMRTGFAAGVTLADGTALSPAEVTALSADGCTVRVVLKQGVYHQIKRMFGVYGAGRERPAPGDAHRAALHSTRPLHRASGGSFLPKKCQKFPADRVGFSPEFQKSNTFFR